MVGLARGARVHSRHRPVAGVHWPRDSFHCWPRQRHRLEGHTVCDATMVRAMAFSDRSHWVSIVGNLQSRSYESFALYGQNHCRHCCSRMTCCHCVGGSTRTLGGTATVLVPATLLNDVACRVCSTALYPRIISCCPSPCCVGIQLLEILKRFSLFLLPRRIPELFLRYQLTVHSSLVSPPAFPPAAPPVFLLPLPPAPIPGSASSGKTQRMVTTSVSID